MSISNPKHPENGVSYGGIMKKILLISLIAMMLLSMVAFAGCKPKAEQPATDEMAPMEEAAPVVDTTVVVTPEATPAPATK
jgi:Na+-transporting NADH:ubiquinone oxidoreductase subunit NqrC